MIIYEVQFKETVWAYGGGNAESVYFSNEVKAKSFVAKNKKHIETQRIIKHEVPTSKCGVIKFLNRENGIG